MLPVVDRLALAGKVERAGPTSEIPSPLEEERGMIVPGEAAGGGNAPAKPSRKEETPAGDLR